MGGMRRDLQLKDRFRPISEEIVGFFMNYVIDKKGKYNATDQ